jgi:hypothetical protein
MIEAEMDCLLPLMVLPTPISPQNVSNCSVAQAPEDDDVSLMLVNGQLHDPITPIGLD